MNRLTERACGCYLTGGKDAYFWHECHTHAAAPEMLTMLRDWPVNMTAAEWNVWHARRRTLLARIDG